MDADPFTAAPAPGGQPDWFVLIAYAAPIIIWLIAFWRSRRFSLRSLFILMAVYACLLTAVQWPFRSQGHDSAGTSFLEETLRHRELSTGPKPIELPMRLP